MEYLSPCLVDREALLCCGMKTHSMKFDFRLYISAKMKAVNLLLYFRCNVLHGEWSFIFI